VRGVVLSTSPDQPNPNFVTKCNNWILPNVHEDKA